MTWQNDSSSTPFAQCFINTCDLDQNVANEYTFSADPGTGTFNLTFVVSNNNNGTTFRCSDGSTFADVPLLMKGKLLQKLLILLLIVSVLYLIF